MMRMRWLSITILLLLAHAGGLNAGAVWSMLSDQANIDADDLVVISEDDETAERDIECDGFTGLGGLRDLFNEEKDDEVPQPAQSEQSENESN